MDDNNDYPFNGMDNSGGFCFSAGILVNIPISERLSVQPELLYTSESTHYNGEFYRTTDNGRLFEKVRMEISELMSTLRVPLLLKLSFGKSTAGQFGVLAGPSFSRVLVAKDIGKGKSTETNQPINYEVDITEYMEKFQFGISIGADYRILENLIVDVRFNNNLTPRFSEESPYKSSFSNVLLGVGYWF